MYVLERELKKSKKTFLENFKKGLDKANKMCYNKNVLERVVQRLKRKNKKVFKKLLTNSKKYGII